MAEKLKPCPFCGRKMVFHKNTYTNKYGKQVTEQYYMHEDYDINKEESCILDDIDMPFTIGAGDARPDTGYIGEYGEKWNTRVAPHHNANTETCVCCGAEIPEGRQVCPVCENGEDK